MKVIDKNGQLKTSGTAASGGASSLDAATQAQMETGTDITVAVTPGRAQYHQSAAKAWISFDGDVVGAPSILASYNITSITDNGTGDYTINIETDFSSVNYCATFGFLPNATASATRSDEVFIVAKTAGTLQIRYTNAQTVAASNVYKYTANNDAAQLDIAMFGDQ